MTTPVNSFQDILEAMEREPALRDALRRHILTEELIQLPAQFAEHKAQFAEHKTEFAEHKTEFAEFIRVTREHNELVDRRLERLETEVATIGGHMSRMIGADQEGEAARLAPRRVRQHLEVLNARVVHRPGPGYDNFMGDLAASATQDRNIDDPEADDLERADLVLTGTSPQGQAVYVLAEVSVTVQREDIASAKRRAELLRRATGVETLPAAMGNSITGEAAEDAAEDKVAFIPVRPEQQP